MMYYIVIYGVRYFIYRSIEDNMPKHYKWVAGLIYVVL